MVLFALKAWLASIFAWPALMVLYDLRWRVLPRVITRSEYGNLWISVGINLMSGALIATLVLGG